MPTITVDLAPSDNRTGRSESKDKQKKFVSVDANNKPHQEGTVHPVMRMAQLVAKGKRTDLVTIDTTIEECDSDEFLKGALWYALLRILDPQERRMRPGPEVEDKCWKLKKQLDADPDTRKLQDMLKFCMKALRELVLKSMEAVDMVGANEERGRKA